VISRYASPAGVIVLVVGGGCCLVAYRLMMRIGRLPQERRILTSGGFTISEGANRGN
jgi:tight adherence protein B